jgi:HEAT repeat protein
MAIGDAKAAVREEAATALGTLQVPSKGSISDLALALPAEKNARVRKAMAWALGQFGKQAAAAVPALAEMLKDKEPETRLAAVSALEKIGDPALPALARAIRSKHDDVRKAALDALAKSKGTATEDAVPDLVEALKADDTQVRLGAVIILGKIGPAARAAVPNLGEALEDANDEVGIKAAEALGKIGKAGVPALAKGLKSENEKVRKLAAHGLGQAGEAARVAAPALADLVADKKAGIEARTSAAFALARAGTGLKVPAQPLVDALIEKAGGKTQSEIEAANDFRRHISVALANIGTPAVEPLVDTLKELNPFVRQYVREALGKIGKPAVPALIDALKNGTSFPVRSGAIAALGEIGPAAREAVAELTAALQDPDRGISNAAKDALKKINKNTGKFDNVKD